MVKTRGARVQAALKCCLPRWQLEARGTGTATGPQLLASGYSGNGLKFCGLFRVKPCIAAMAAPPPPPARVQARLVVATADADADASENSEAEHSRFPPNRRGEGKKTTLKRAATGNSRLHGP
jgi:hypothetical protein